MNTGILYAKMGITVFISLYTTRLILNSLGVSDFGIFNIVGGVISMLGFFQGALTVATLRYMAYAEGEGDREKKRKIFNVSIVLHFLLSILTGVILFICGYIFLDDVLNIPLERKTAAHIIYYFMVVSTVFTIMSVPYDAILNAHENMLYYAIIGIIESVLKLITALFVVYTLSDKLITYGLLTTCIALTTLILMRLYCHHKYEECVFNPKVYLDKKLIKEMSKFSGWNFLGSSSSMITASGQGIVLNMFFGTIANAAQGIAGQINGQISVFSATLMKALNPVFSKSEGAGNRALMIEATMMGSKISLFLFAFMCIPAFIEMPYILKLWLKNVPDYAIIFCRLLLIRSTIEQLVISVSSSVTAHGNIKRYEIVTSIFYCIPLVVSFFLFRAGFSPYALYVVYIVYAVIMSTTILYFAWNNYGFPVTDFLKRIVFRCVIVMAVVFTLSCIPSYAIKNDLLRLASVMTVSTAVFIICAWMIGFNARERMHLKSLVMPILTKIIKFKF